MTDTHTWRALSTAPVTVLEDLAGTLHELIMRNPDDDLTEILSAVAMDIPMAIAAVES